MLHKRIGAALVTIAVITACSHPRVETAGGEISTPATPANARMLPVGTLLDVVLNQQLGTQSFHSGDVFSANVINAVIAQNGRTTVPAGSVVWGHVTSGAATNNATPNAALALAFDSLTFNGRQYPFAANVTATNPQRTGSGMLAIGSHLSLQTTRSIALR